ncbi:MAG: hypothetical protein AAF443_08000 [Chlamydiota bacterium]
MLNSNEIEETYERLKAYPSLLKKVKGMLDLMEKEKVESSDDFEEALIPQVRNLGKDIIRAWASEEEKTAREHLEESGKGHHSKKNSTGTQPLEK